MACFAERSDRRADAEWHARQDLNQPRGYDALRVDADRALEDLHQANQDLIKRQGDLDRAKLEWDLLKGR